MFRVLLFLYIIFYLCRHIYDTGIIHSVGQRFKKMGYRWENDDDKHYSKLLCKLNSTYGFLSWFSNICVHVRKLGPDRTIDSHRIVLVSVRVLFPRYVQTSAQNKLQPTRSLQNITKRDLIAWSNRGITHIQQLCITAEGLYLVFLLFLVDFEFFSTLKFYISSDVGTSKKNREYIFF